MITLEINNQVPRRMDLFTAIEKTDYHQNVKDDLVLFLMDNFNSKQNRFYFLNKISESSSQNIIVIQHKMKASLGGKTYDIPLLIYFNDSFPLSAPEIYIEKRGNHLEINKRLPNGFISKRTLRINYELYYKWDKVAKSIIDVLSYLNRIFNKYFPIYSSRDVMPYEGFCVLDIKRATFIYLNEEDSDPNESRYIDTTLNTTISSNTRTTKGDFITPGFDVVDMNTPQGENTETMINDEDLKKNLIEKIVSLVKGKIIEERKEQERMKIQLENIRDDMNNKIQIYSKVIAREATFQKTINDLYSDLQENDIDGITKNNTYHIIYNTLSQMNSVQKCQALLQINNPKTLHRFANELTYEEIIFLCKQMLQKDVLSIQDIIKYIRTTSLTLFKVREGQRMHPFE